MGSRITAVESNGSGYGEEVVIRFNTCTVMRSAEF